MTIRQQLQADLMNAQAALGVNKISWVQSDSMTEAELSLALTKVWVSSKGGK